MMADNLYFFTSPSTGRTVRSCRQCRYETLKNWRECHPEQRRLTRLGWKQRNGEKNSAHVAVNQAIKRGKLIRGACVQCGTTEDVQAHHHNGYLKPHRLDVQWLCRRHHDNLHKSI